MADRPTPEPIPEPAPLSESAPRPTGRPVYESTLLPPRKRRRWSPWLVVPALLLFLLGLLWFLLFGPKPRRAIVSAGQVAYVSDAGTPGVTHLWLMDAASGQGAHALTAGSSADSSLTFSADGSQIAFVSNRDGGQNQIFLMDADGKNVSQITRTTGSKARPAFAPGSNSLLGLLSGAALAVADVNRGDAVPLLPAPTRQEEQPQSTDPADPAQAREGVSVVTQFAWKPGGDLASPGLAAVLEKGGIQTLAVLPSLSAPPILTQTGAPGGPPLAAADALSTAWTPDGSHLAVALLHVQGLPGGKIASGLLQFDAQGQNPKPLLPLIQDPAVGPQNPVYSPDGHWLAFELWRQPDLASRARLGLYLIPAGGGALRLLAKGDAGAAQFSPDSGLVFFLQRRPDGGHDLRRVETNGTGAARVSDGLADVTGFALSPQGAAAQKASP